MDKKLKEIEEIKDPFFSKATLIVGRGEDDAWLIDKKDFNDYATALQSYMRRKELEGRIEASKTIKLLLENDIDKEEIECIDIFTKALEQQLKSEEK